MASKKKPAAKALSPARPGKPAPASRRAAPRPVSKKRPAAVKPDRVKASAARPSAPKPVSARPVATKAEPGPKAAPKAGPTRPPAAKPRGASVVSRRRVQKRAAPSEAAAEAEDQHPTLQDEGGPVVVPGLSEEDQIRAAKYLPRDMPKRVFEEERFLFPDSYGVDRIRLLVRDPEWIFAYWDVSPDGMKSLGRSLGERALALSRLTLRILDPVGGGSMDILLPPGARWWYVRTDSARRTYRAELGVTLPSGEFRRIAESNTVVTPRVGPSAEAAGRHVSYPDASQIPLSASDAAAEADRRAGLASEPWQPGNVDGAAEPGETDGRRGDRGGASDTFRPGAGDRPGASDAFRR